MTNQLCLSIRSSPRSSLRSPQIFIPSGTWVHEATSTNYIGPAHVTLSVPLSSTPQFVKRGAVIPMRPKTTGATYASAISPFEALEFHIYDLRSSGGTTVYEDDGSSTSYYDSDDFSILKFKYTFSNGVFEAKLTHDKVRLDDGLEESDGILRTHKSNLYLLLRSS